MSILINSTTLGNIIIITGSVILLLVLIRLFAWDNITGIFEQRANRIATDIDTAQAARKEAEDLASKRHQELSAAKGEAGQIIANAKELGNTKGEQIITEARLEAGRLKDKAKQDIEQSKSEALASVKGDVADLTILLAEKVMTANLDKKAQSQLIDTYLDQLGDA
ncbi:F0F1 ATP synthase subunit B [Streptococcus sp. zg-JUN1979]|uniref:F0F1 ATP synthase subunit B n=1 Tax=Streptococcus sp. zg-JUN1979 TaxID=3391450 RepID=UPI0039A67041